MKHSRKSLTSIVGLVSLVACGCTAGRHHIQSFQAPNGAKCERHHFTANMYGPGVRQAEVFCDKDPQLVSTTYAIGPDAGVALGTAGLQGAALAGSAAVLGTSFPTNKGTSVSATGGASGGSSSSAGATTSQAQAQSQAQSQSQWE